MLCVVVCAFNAITWEAEAEAKFCEFEVGLVYIVSPRAVRAT